MPEFGIKFIRKDSLFHRIDPISKFIYAIAMGLMIFVTSNVVLQILLISVSIFIALVCARMSLRVFVKPLTYLLPIIFGIIAFTPLIIGHTPIFQGSQIPYYVEGLNFGVFMSLRWMAFLISSFTFIWATHPRDLVQGLAEIGVPYTIAHAFEIAFAFLPVVDYEAMIISYSQKVRQVGSGKHLFRATWERIFKLLIALLLRGVKHSQTLAVALNSRGYGAYEKRNYMNKLEKPTYGLVFRYLWIALAAVWIIYSIYIGGFGYTGIYR